MLRYLSKYTRGLKRYLWPHEHNEWKPHVFRELSVSLIAVLALFVFGITLIGGAFIRQTDLGAAIESLFLIDLTNQHRQSLSVQSLRVDPLLTKAAELKAADMIEHGYFAHTSPDGKSPWYWFSEAGYQFEYAGENLAIDFVNSEDVEQAWLNSPGHRANIVNNHFTDIGIAVVNGTYQGRPTTFVVELFGKPAQKIGSAQTVTLASTALTVPKATSTEVLGTTIIAKSASSSSPKATKAVGIATSHKKATSTKEVVKAVATSTLEVMGSTNSAIVAQNDLYIAVAQHGEGIELVSDSVSGSGVSNMSSNFTWLERLIANPSSAAKNFYLGLIAFLACALLVFVFATFDRQHPKHVVYGFLLMLLVWGLYMTLQMISGSVVKIV